MKFLIVFISLLVIAQSQELPLNEPQEPLFFDIFENGTAEWQMVFRGTPGILSSTYSAYVNQQVVQVEPACLQLDPSNAYCFHHYRHNDILDNWKDVDQVALIIYKGGKMGAYVIFDGKGSDNQNWFDHTKILDSSWTDIKNQGTNFFSVKGDDRLQRRFFMEHTYGGCPHDSGWFVVVDEWLPSTFCPWEKTKMNQHRVPVFLYSNTTTLVNWNSNDVEVADDFMIFIKLADSGVVIG